MVIIPDARDVVRTSPNSAVVAELQGDSERARADDVTRVAEVTSRGGGSSTARSCSPKNRSSFHGDERALLAGDRWWCSGVGQRPESVGDATTVAGDSCMHSEAGGDGASSTGVADEMRGDMRWTAGEVPDVERPCDCECEFSSMGASPRGAGLADL